MALIDNGKNLATDTDGQKLLPTASRFDFSSTIDESLWNKSLPYQLAVVEAYRNSTDQTVAYHVYNNLIFTLPINPEAMSVGTPFAISVTATQGGVVEQHGGAPFRSIQFSGSLGVLNNRPSGSSLQAAAQGGLGALARFAAGTSQALANVGTVAGSLGIGQKFTSNLLNEVPTLDDGSNNNIVGGNTGYYQFRALQRFLETYVEAKKQSAGASLRLALIIWKDQAAYLVTPQSFDVQRAANGPYEYRYSLRLQAWRRIDPQFIGAGTAGASGLSHFTSKSSFSMAQVHKAVSDAIRMAQASTNVLKAVRRDLAKTFDLMRQTALFCAAAGGIVKTGLALPAGIRTDFTKAAAESWDIVSRSFDGLDPKTKSTMAAITAEVGNTRSGSATTSPTLTAALADDEQTDIHDLIRPDAINLPPAARSALSDHLDEVATMTSDDFRAIADQVFSLVDDYADVVGLNDPQYDRLAGRSPKVKVRDATLDDFRAMHSLAEAAIATLSLVVNAPSRQPITTVEYVAGLANANGIDMRVPKSKFAAPFPYGSSLERLAQQYLGDATRWMEIAELNELRAPYVDEEGVTVKLLANGSGHTITIADGQDLVLGQFLTLWSDRVFGEKRRIVNIEDLGPGQWRITLDGEADMASLKLSENASVRWFRVGTVNSQQVIYIPSDSPGDTDILKYVPGVDDLNRILTAGEVDGALDSTGDLVITPDGDWPFVFGLAYLIQWARLAFTTKRGALSLHPDFGFSVQVGESNADATAQDLLKSLRATVQSNPSFAGVASALVVREGPTTQVAAELAVRNVDALLPITFDVKS